LLLHPQQQKFTKRNPQQQNFTKQKIHNSTFHNNETKTQKMFESQKLPYKKLPQVQDAISDGMAWMESNADSDAEDIKDKHKEIEGICAPIIQKHYGGAGGAGGAGGDDDDEEDDGHDDL
jgi:hypothetical protein